MTSLASPRRFLSGALLFGALCFSSLLPDANAGVLLEQNPMPSDRTTQQLPYQSIWYTSGSTSAGKYTDGSYKVGGNNHFVTYFTDASAPLTLQVGQTLTATFSFRLAGVVTTETTTLLIRFALLDSGGSRITADGQGGKNPLFAGYTGYAAYLLHNQSYGNTQFLQRNAHSSEPADAATNQLISSNSAYDSLKSLGAKYLYTDDVQYTCTYTLTRTSEGMVMSVNVLADGVSVITQNYTTTGDIYTTFDTFAFFGGGSNALTSYMFDNISISVIPEPGSVGLALGVAPVVLGALVFRKRRKF